MGENNEMSNLIKLWLLYDNLNVPYKLFQYLLSKDILRVRQQ